MSNPKKVGSPVSGVFNEESFFAQHCDRRLRDRLAVLLNIIDTPPVNLLDRFQRHRSKYEITLLAHAEATRAGLVSRLIVHEAGELFTVKTVDPVFFDGLSVVEVFTILGESD